MNSKVTGEGGDEEVKKTIAIFAYKQRILIIEMITKLVQHVSRINLTVGAIKTSAPRIVPGAPRTMYPYSPGQ